MHLAFSGVLLSSVFFAGGSLDGVALRALDVGLLPDDLTGVTTGNSNGSHPRLSSSKPV